MATNSGWTTGLPSGSSQVANVDEEFRSLKSFQEAWWEDEHYATSGSATSAGVHKTGSARAYSQSAQPTAISPKGQLWHDTDDDSLSIYNGSSWVKLVDNIKLDSANSWSALNEYTSGLSASQATISGNLNLGSDTVLFRAAANHIETSDVFETTSYASVSGLTAGSMKIGGGDLIKKIGTATAVFPLIMGPPASGSTHTIVSAPTGFTGGDMVFVTQTGPRMPNDIAWSVDFDVANGNIKVQAVNPTASAISLGAGSVCTVSLLLFDIT